MKTNAELETRQTPKQLQEQRDGVHVRNFKTGKASRGRVRQTHADAIRLGKLHAQEVSRNAR